MRLVPHRLPSPIAWPHTAMERLSRGRVAHVAVTPTTCPASAAQTHARVPRRCSAAPPATIIVTIPTTAVARKCPGTAPTDERIDHQWPCDGLASRTANWSRQTR